MNCQWKSILKSTFENRPIEIKISNENDFRIITIQNEDIEAFYENYEGSDIGLHPYKKGDQISINGSTKNEIESGLKSVGFNDSTIIKILEIVGSNII